MNTLNHHSVKEINMADDNVYRQNNKISRDEIDQASEQDLQNEQSPVEGDPLQSIRDVQQAVAQATGREAPSTFTPKESPFEISGNVPPQFQQALQARQHMEDIENQPPVNQSQQVPKKENKFQQRRSQQSPTPDSQVRVTGTDRLEEALGKLASLHHWETFTWPSKAKFYSGIPETIHVRPMTGEEEQILATPRFVKRGKAIDMIFQRCIQENINTEELLSADRTNLLIYLRGISYTPEYDVEIKCPECGIKFSTVIDLNMLDVEDCPDDFGLDQLEGVLPASGFHYRYRLSTGIDEQNISQYRDRRISKWGDQSEDDTLLYRTAILLEEIEGVTMIKEIQHLLKRLPIADVAHLRNEISIPPFGVDTEVMMLCPSCTEEFTIDLPLETSFFFPRKKMVSEAQA